MNANIKETQIFHKMKYDFIVHFYGMKMFCDFLLLDLLPHLQPP